MPARQRAEAISRAVVKELMNHSSTARSTGRRTLPGPEPRRRDRGSTLVEAAAAMMIAVIILLGLAATMAGGLRHLQENRLQQQATQLAVERLEFARSLTFAQVGVDPAVPDTDPRIVSNPRSLRGSAFGLPGNEDLIEKNYGNPDAAVPYLYIQTLEGAVFTTRSYVSRTEPGLRRVIVCVSWDTGRGGTREVVMSTSISEVSTS